MTTHTEALEALTEATRILSGARILVTHNPEAVITRLAKLAKRARRLGLPEPTAVEAERWTVTRTRDGVAVKVPQVRIVIQGKAPALNGYTPIARLEHGPAGNVIQAFSEIDEAWRTAEAHCEHCNTKRGRKITILFREESTGRILQIGHSCAADYCRTDYGMLAYLAGWFDLFVPERDEDFGGGVAGWVSDRTYEIAAFALAATREAPYLKRGSEGASTADLVAFARGAKPTGHNAERWEELQPTADDYHAAGYLCAYWSTIDPKSDYAWNLRTIALQGYVLPKQIGLWVSAVAGYRKATQTLKTRNANAKRANEHLASVGDKIRINVKIERCHGFETQFGYSWLIVARTAEGHRVTWTQSSNPDRDWRDGWIVGTVKRHTEYKGTQETRLSRVTTCPETPKWFDGLRVYRTKKEMLAA